MLTLTWISLEKNILTKIWSFFTLIWSCLLLYSIWYHYPLTDLSIKGLFESLGLVWLLTSIKQYYSLSGISYDKCNIVSHNSNQGKNRVKKLDIVAKIRGFVHTPSPLRNSFIPPEEVVESDSDGEDNKEEEKRKNLVKK